MDHSPISPTTQNTPARYKWRVHTYTNTLYIMLHTTNRVEVCSILRAISLEDYLKETNSTTEVTDSNRYLARVEARTSGTAGAPLEGVDTDALTLLSQYIGSNVSCLINCESADGLTKALAAINGMKGKKVPFTIYEAAISDVLAELSKNGIAIRNEDTKRRYSRLSRSYFGNLGDSRAADAANGFLQDTENMLSDGWKIVEK